MRTIEINDDEFTCLASHLKMKDEGFDFMSVDNLIRFKRKKLNEMPTKHIMTRAEAIACFEKHMPTLYDAGAIIDFYIAAGMLEIKEEEELPGLPLGFEFPFSKRDEWTNCVNEMFKQGYKIVPK